MLNQPYPQKPVKVIQFGEGNFLRAFVDWMIHKMNEKDIFNGQVALVQPIENGLISLLEKQNYAYTHYLKGIKDGIASEEHYINHSIATTVNPYKDFKKYLSLAAIDTASIIVSNTTEAGIVFDATDRFDKDAHVTFPGKLTHLLYQRFKLTKGDMNKGYLLLPCELIDNNADKLKTAVLNYISLWKLPNAFKDWVLKANTFCNTLVDRIVPGYPKATIEHIWKSLGYEDKLVVESEYFHLWVIEGSQKIHDIFPAASIGCNVLLVDDVTPYKTRKVRILNGAHTTMVPIAYLYGLKTVGESIENPTINPFILKALFEEIIPTLTLSKEELEIYAKEVVERFKNPYIKHNLLSISLNSMSKYKTRVLPSVTAYIDRHHHFPKRLCGALAAYIVFYRGNYQGNPIPLHDTPDILELFKSLWQTYDGTIESVHAIVYSILAYEPNWKGNLNHIPGLTDLITEYVFILLQEDMDTLLTHINEVNQ